MAASISLMEMSLILIVPLVMFGGMAAALLVLIYGIVKKRPAVIAASVAAPFLLIVGGFLFVGLARFKSEQAHRRQPFGHRLGSKCRRCRQLLRCRPSTMDSQMSSSKPTGW